MTLKLEDKKAIVAEVTEIAKQSLSAVAADYRGLTVAEMTELRRKARDAGIYLRVVRNTLAKRALQETDFACLNEALVGPLFLAFAKEEPGVVAKLVKEFAKDHENLTVKALALSGKLYGPESLDAIAMLPTREQAIAMLMSVMLAPVTDLVRTMAEPYAKLTRTFAALESQQKG